MIKLSKEENNCFEDKVEILAYLFIELRLITAAKFLQNLEKGKQELYHQRSLMVFINIQYAGFYDTT